jgi:hypothetical protein
LLIFATANSNYEKNCAIVHRQGKSGASSPLSADDFRNALVRAVASRQSQALLGACDWQLAVGNWQLYLFEFTF